MYLQRIKTRISYVVSNILRARAEPFRLSVYTVSLAVKRSGRAVSCGFLNRSQRA